MIGGSSKMENILVIKEMETIYNNIGFWLVPTKYIFYLLL